ncbi:MAG TPA: sulfite exporter TauE/SafE family protein [Flavobacterium sp.]|uniref:sulfite exporter TauE/SafE family protein n=1 Tax=Flavobacterium sp. TaxID=239 RepID=UPI002CDF679E|nr:sulfite exporter TauE/SafE family protein [Flavobacterium sp.]HNP33531.1 sulfite exporter TauE/SafE family protein [Flavobacterium sp.]
MLTAAFFLGLISSLHCIGMCGPIAMMLPVSQRNPERKAVQIIIYHLGRIVSYSIIGLLFGILGRGFYMAGIQQQLSIFAGVAMIVIIALPANVFARYNFSRPLYQLISKLKSLLGKQFSKSSLKSIFSIGILNGLLPCAMVYAAVFGALAMPTILFSVLFMAVFGAGTVPLMSGVVYLQQLFPMTVRNRIQKMIPIAITCLGVLFIIRGLGIGIPYLSPGTMNLFVQAQPNCH